MHPAITIAAVDGTVYLAITTHAIRGTGHPAITIAAMDGSVGAAIAMVRWIAAYTPQTRWSR